MAITSINALSTVTGSPANSGTGGLTNLAFGGNTNSNILNNLLKSANTTTGTADSRMANISGMAGGGLGTGTVSSSPVATSTNSVSAKTSPRDTGIEDNLRKATAQQENYLNEAKDLYNQYRTAGTESLDAYMKLLMGGVDGLKDDKNFQDLSNFAERKVMANRAVGGMLRSSGTASALNDSLLNFANSYYDNRLKELQGGIQYGTYGTDAQTNLLQQLGVSGTDLAEALANIKMQRESNTAMIDAAKAQAGATTSAAKKAGEDQMVAAAIGALGSIFAASDRRLKTDLKLVGKSHNGLNIYLGRYTKESGLDDGKQHLFLIAQEVMEVVPEAVIMGENGYYKVNYEKALEE